MTFGWGEVTGGEMTVNQCEIENSVMATGDDMHTTHLSFKEYHVSVLDGFFVLSSRSDCSNNTYKYNFFYENCEGMERSSFLFATSAFCGVF